ncbi:response regulator [Paraburkholderia rhizosphaerae]|uniref:Response regulator receiver domain-containing protein n=1 Tax=Paraburkholderia rhizosphaerae TaxID=480658 RepID=A0A4R8LYR8_9BURK|nr:response regulator [Paraburkholderia rhizosphaerae]TDY51955.1 response regulator receiver domain-containing protein [Paraburkholderia rhizosphaerae]
MADILIVDADTGVLSTLGLLIAAEGYVVRTATNGNDALDLARASRPDVLISDSRTPGLSGAALVREMRKDPVLASVPVILAYNGALPPRVRVFRFLRKPLRYARLLKLLHRAEQVGARRDARGHAGSWKVVRRNLKGEPKPG